MVKFIGRFVVRLRLLLNILYTNKPLLSVCPGAHFDRALMCLGVHISFTLHQRALARLGSFMPSKQPYPARNYALGEYLLTLRSRTKLTQAELAARIGVNRRSVQKWESG